LLVYLVFDYFPVYILIWYRQLLTLHVLYLIVYCIVLTSIVISSYEFNPASGRQ